jgi:DNA-binding transcriptional MerR regulator
MLENKNFTINDLERHSGIKAHTLRAWERRYSLLHPTRTAGNLRLYRIDELKLIMNISLLTKNGYRISWLSSIHTNEIEDKVLLLSDDKDQWQHAVYNLTICMYNGEPEAFEDLLDKLLLTWKIEILIEKILFPFLKTTGLLWIGHKLCEEHLVVTAVRKKLILGIETLNLKSKGEKTVLLFLPDTKQLDLGLLYANFFLKRRGTRIIYLGNDITIQNLNSICSVYAPTYLFTYLPENHHFPVQQLLHCINQNARYAKFIIGNYSEYLSAPTFSDNLIQMSYSEALEFLCASCK